MTDWLCEVCGGEWEGEDPSGGCPSCGAGSLALLPRDETTGSPFFGFPKTLEEVRDRARKRLKGFCAAYPACDGSHDRICQREAYGKSIGFGGAGSGASFAANVQSLKDIRLNTRLVGPPFSPDTSCSFLGQALSIPILGSSTAGIEKYNHTVDEIDFCRMTIRGCREAGTLALRGDTWFYTLENHPGLAALEKEGGGGIPIFKPRAQEDLKRLIERTERAGCPAVGVDLDGCGSTIMARHGQPVFRKTLKDIEELVRSTSLPFIAKGIMDPEDALGCAEAGVQVVAVSNHGGRVLDGTPGVAEILPAIAAKVGGRVTITADGGVRTGYDVFKMLALGADAVLSGRDIIRAAVGGGTLGVRLQMERFKAALIQAMVMTGCAAVGGISPKNLA